MPVPVFTIRRFARGVLSVLSIVAIGAAYAAGQPVATVRDPLPPTIAGEYALQAGKLDDAAREYLAAAKAAEGDVVLAERATRIALLARNEALASEALALWQARAPRSYAMRGAELTLAIQRDDERAALRELKSLLAGRPEPDAKVRRDGWRFALLALDAGSGDPKRVGALLEKVVYDLPEELEAWLAFGEFAQQLQRHDLAEKIINRVLQHFPNVPGVALLQANQLRRAGKTDEARAVLAKVAGASILLPDVAVGLAREYSAIGDHTAAAEVLARGPQTDNTYMLRASYFAQANDKAGVTRVYDELKRDSAAPNPARRLLLGQVAEFIERYTDALDWYTSVPGGPQRWQARLRMATVLHKLARKDDAYARLRDLQTDAGVDDETRRDAYLLEANLFREDNAAVKEREAFDRGLAAFPDEAELLYARALMWERQDDITRAEADFRRILAIDADDVNALNALGYTLADRTDRFQEALELISRAIAAEPDSAAIIDSYGWVLYRLGRNEEALAELRRAFTKQKDAEIAAHVAEVLWALGRKEEAVSYFEQSRKIDPTSRSLKRAIEKTGVSLPPAVEKAGA